jgi:hypothetical protein
MGNPTLNFGVTPSAEIRVKCDLGDLKTFRPRNEVYRRTIRFTVFKPVSKKDSHIGRYNYFASMFEVAEASGVL